MYAKYGDFEHAKSIFNAFAERDVVTWNALIAGYVQGGCFQEALEIYTKMLECSVNPSNATYVSIMKACSNMEDLEHGQIVHSCIVENGIEPGLSMQNILIDMYCKCGSVENAEMIFIRLPRRNEVTCNALLLGHTLHKHIDNAFHVFNQMQQEGIKASLATFLGILKACSKVPMVDQGKNIHAQIIERQFGTDLCIQNSLINMYVKGSCMLDAYQVFDSLSCKDAVSFSSMMEVCYHFVKNNTAFRFFYQMLQEHIAKSDNLCHHFEVMLQSCRCQNHTLLCN
mgnify:FL=1